jgi:intein/homing endonuclease
MKNTTICEKIQMDNSQGRECQNDGKLPSETVCSTLNCTKEDFYYLLGYTYADGCVDYNKSTLRIRWQSKDKDLIEWIQKILKLDTSVSQYENKYFYIQKTSNNLVQNFLSLGIIPNKTYMNIFPTIDKKYFKYFTRGYFDGDGCISLRNDKSGSWLQVQIVNKLKENLQSFGNILKEELGIIPKIYNHEECYRLQYSHLESLSIFWYMYDNNAFYLSRKKEVFENWLKNRNQENYGRRKCDICNNIYSLLHDKSRICHSCKQKVKTQSDLNSNIKLT